MQLPTIISDLDGTYVNILDVLLDRLWCSMHVAVSPECIKEYNVADCLWRHSEEIRLLFFDIAALDRFLRVSIWNSPSAYALARPYWDWHAALHEFSGRDGRIIFLTSRPPLTGIVKATTDWLNEMGHEDCDLRFSKAYEGGKLEAVQEVIDEAKSEVWLVDDDTSLHHACEERSIHLLIPKRHWTIGFETANPTATLLEALQRK